MRNIWLISKKYGYNTPDTYWCVTFLILPSLGCWWVLVIITLAVVSILDNRFSLLPWCSTKMITLINIYTKYAFWAKIIWLWYSWQILIYAFFNSFSLRWWWVLELITLGVISILDNYFSFLRGCSTKKSTLIEIYTKFGLWSERYGCNNPESSWDVQYSIPSSLRWWWWKG